MREMFLFNHVGVSIGILVSRTVNRSRRRDKTQRTENPAQESHYNENLIELACSVRFGKILVEFLFCKFMEPEN